MKIAAAWSESATWYPVVIDEQTQVPALVPVIVALAGGGLEVLAEIRRHPTRRMMWWWYQLGAWTGDGYGWALTKVIKLEKVWHEPVSDFSPVAFRPVDLNAWRRPLPKPLPPAFGPKSPSAVAPEPAEGIDPHHGSDDWPYPGLRLGQLTVPASREECEARILRAFRTSASRGGGGPVGHVSRAFCADIPSEMIKVALKHYERERVREELQRGIAQPVEAVRSGWTPSKRDLTDWDFALGWLSQVDARLVDVVELRAADPPFSFPQIAQRLRGMRSHVTARRLYDRAIDHAFASAKFNGQQARGQV